MTTLSKYGWTAPRARRLRAAVIAAALTGVTACEMAASDGSDAGGQPGVTDDAISFGFIYTTGAEELAKAIGGPDAGAGDSKRQIEAVVKAVNDGGGIAGRRVELLTYAFKAGEPIDSQLQAACTFFTEDNTVFAVSGNVAGVTGAAGDVLYNCLGKKNVAYIESANAGDTQSYERLPNIAYAPATLTADRKSAVLVDALEAAGWFGTDAVIGVHSLDTPMWRKVVEETVKPRLEAHGLNVAEQFDFRLGAAGAEGASEYSAATLQFKKSGVTHVLNIGNHPLLFASAAEAQQWRPKWSVDSEIAPANWVANVPPAQLAGSLGVGWAPSRDLPAAQRGEPVNDEETRCADIMAAAGEDPKQAVAWQFQLTACSSVFFLEAALDAAPEMTTAGLAAGMAELGNAYLDPATWRTSFEPGRRDGLGAYRMLSYSEKCRCFEYSSDLIDIPR